MSQSRLDELRMVDPVLTTIVQGYSNENYIFESLFPTVQVSKIKGKIPVFGKESFVIRESARAIRALSNRIPPTDFKLIQFETTEKDIEMSLDYIEEEETPDFLRLEQKIAKQLTDIIMIGKEKESADLAQDSDSYLSDMVEDLSSTDAFDNYSASDPIILIRDAISSIRLKIGRYPNTMIMGDVTYQALINHPKLLSRITYSGNSGIDKKVLQEIFEIPKIVVGKSVYSSDGLAFQDIWRDNLILAYVDGNDKQARSEFNPSFGYTFQREGKPEIDTYYENGGKMKVIRNTDNYCIKITASDAGFLIKNTIQA